jgi:hypothetical protein
MVEPRLDTGAHSDGVGAGLGGRPYSEAAGAVGVVGVM